MQGRARAIALLVGILSAALFGIGPSHAQGLPLYSGPARASDNRVTEFFGGVTYSMTTCSALSRTVRVDVGQFSAWDSRWSYSFRSAIGEVLRRAIEYAWANCAVYSANSANPGMVDSVSVYGPGGELEVVGTGVEPTESRFAGQFYYWAQITDYSRDRWLNDVWRFLGLVLAGAGLIWLWRRREAIARWYYFTFHPHPAAPLLEAAMASDSPVDAKALARVLGELPAGSATFRSVRLEQAEALFARMQKVSAYRIEALERRAQSDYERAALHSIQAALAMATVALERAKALYRASLRVTEETYP